MEIQEVFVQRKPQKLNAIKVTQEWFDVEYRTQKQYEAANLVQANKLFTFKGKGDGGILMCSGVDRVELDDCVAFIGDWLVLEDNVWTPFDAPTFDKAFEIIEGK